MSEPKECPDCDGNGEYDSNGFGNIIICELCNGRGYVQSIIDEPYFSA